jgi:hypothetical protein
VIGLRLQCWCPVWVASGSQGRLTNNTAHTASSGCSSCWSHLRTLLLRYSCCTFCAASSTPPNPAPASLPPPPRPPPTHTLACAVPALLAAAAAGAGGDPPPQAQHTWHYTTAPVVATAEAGGGSGAAGGCPTLQDMYQAKQCAHSGCLPREWLLRFALKREVNVYLICTHLSQNPYVAMCIDLSAL